MRYQFSISRDGGGTWEPFKDIYPENLLQFGIDYTKADKLIEDMKKYALSKPKCYEFRYNLSGMHILKLQCLEEDEKTLPDADVEKENKDLKAIITNIQDELIVLRGLNSELETKVLVLTDRNAELEGLCERLRTYNDKFNKANEEQCNTIDIIRRREREFEKLYQEAFGVLSSIHAMACDMQSETEPYSADNTIDE